MNEIAVYFGGVNILISRQDGYGLAEELSAIRTLFHATPSLLAKIRECRDLMSLCQQGIKNINIAQSIAHRLEACLLLTNERYDAGSCNAIYIIFGIFLLLFKHFSIYV
jgi:hypothetical protein